MVALAAAAAAYAAAIVSVRDGVDIRGNVAVAAAAAVEKPIEYHP